MRTRHISRFLLVLATAAILGFPPATPAARGDDVAKTGLSVRQRRYVSAKMQEFERRIGGLIESLEKNDPQRAARLNAALQKSKELSLQQRMEASASLLDQLDLDRATEQQRAILEGLGQVLALLADDETEEDRLAKRLRQLQAWREQIVKLLEDESDQLRESDKVANPERALQRLERDIQALQELIARQDELIRDNQRVRVTDLDGLPKVGQDQGRLRADTAQLADQIAAAQPSSPQSKPTNPADVEPGKAQPGEGKPGEGKPGETEPGEGKPSDGKPSDVKPADGKPGDGKPGDGKPGEQDPDEHEPDENKPGGLRPKKPPQQPGDQGQDEPDGARRPASNQPGSQPLRQAATHQADAQSRLNNSRGKKAEEDQRRALAELRRALKQLEAERNRVAALTPELSKDLADRQAGTSEQTGKLGDEMARAGSPNGGKPNQGQPNQGQPNPVQQAQCHMENAERDLQDKRPDQAGPDQQAAIEDLDRGLQDIDNELRDLQDQQHKQRVAGLLQRYQAMLARQKDATQATAIVEKHRRENGRLRRSDLIMVRRLAEEENALAELAEQALDEILAGDTGTVFPRIAARLRDDLRRVGSRLEQRSTGGDTHIVQVEIEWTLEELIEALSQAQQQGRQGEQNGDGQPKPPGQQPPGQQEKKLLPDKAELKLVRAAQRRVNRLTEAFQQKRGDQPLDDLRRNEVHSIADRQAEISEMTKQLKPVE